jgi:hypothetical protein
MPDPDLNRRIFIGQVNKMTFAQFISMKANILSNKPQPSIAFQRASVRTAQFYSKEVGVSSVKQLKHSDEWVVKVSSTQQIGPYCCAARGKGKKLTSIEAFFSQRAVTVFAGTLVCSLGRI